MKRDRLAFLPWERAALRSGILADELGALRSIHERYFGSYRKPSGEGAPGTRPRAADDPCQGEGTATPALLVANVGRPSREREATPASGECALVAPSASPGKAGCLVPIEPLSAATEESAGRANIPRSNGGETGGSVTAINGEAGQNPRGASSARDATDTHRPADRVGSQLRVPVELESEAHAASRLPGPAR
jgi:hypothetical protein